MNCKKGDLAVVIFVDSVIAQPNVGRVVRVVRRRRSHLYARRGMLACWHIRSEGSPLIGVEGKPLMEGRMPDIALRPIRPLESPETVEHEEEITA